LRIYLNLGYSKINHPLRRSTRYTTAKYNFLVGGCLEKWSRTGNINIGKIRAFNLLSKQLPFDGSVTKTERKAYKDL